MTDVAVLVERPEDWRTDLPGLPVITARDYLTNPDLLTQRRVMLINLCRSQRYQSVGYYCSLLAEARGQQALPSVRTGQDLRRSVPFSPRDGLDARARRFLRGLDGDRLTCDVLFGLSTEPALTGLARELFNTFPAPLLRMELRRAPDWRVAGVRLLAPHRLAASQLPAFADALSRWLNRRWREPRPHRRFRHDLAILVDPAEKLPPSNRKALQKFIAAGRRLGIDCELITQDDFGRLLEFDGLFIRTTTRVDHYSYRFSRRAEREGMVVIDDPTSILRCTNKVYLAELLRRNRVRIPATVILTRENLEQAERECGYPVVLKAPDGSFSRSVFKAGDRNQLETLASEMFRHSALLLAQAYTYTEFDWRVGVLNDQPLFVSQYFMAKNHWQILKHDQGGQYAEGTARTLTVEQAPAGVVRTALRAANLVGNGLYGVDLKQVGRAVMVIEVNDNPNLDAGVEDLALGNELYIRLMREFLSRLDDAG